LWAEGGQEGGAREPKGFSGGGWFDLAHALFCFFRARPPMRFSAGGEGAPTDSRPGEKGHPGGAGRNFIRGGTTAVVRTRDFLEKKKKPNFGRRSHAVGKPSLSCGRGGGAFPGGTFWGPLGNRHGFLQGGCRGAFPGKGQIRRAAKIGRARTDKLGSGAQRGPGGQGGGRNRRGETRCFGGGHMAG